jgi:hypothetical protein
VALEAEDRAAKRCVRTSASHQPVGSTQVVEATLLPMGITQEPADQIVAPLRTLAPAAAAQGTESARTGRLLPRILLPRIQSVDGDRPPRPCHELRPPLGQSSQGVRPAVRERTAGVFIQYPVVAARIRARNEAQTLVCVLAMPPPRAPRLRVRRWRHRISPRVGWCPRSPPHRW